MSDVISRFAGGLATGLVCGFLLTAQAGAQSQQAAIFVANNGNCEGSVTSFLVNDNGTLQFVEKVVSGSVPCGSGQTAPGLNAQAVDISPNGRWLVTGHGTISSTVEQLTFYEVFADASFDILFETTTPDSPVDVEWLSDEYLAVTATPPGNDFVIIYRFDPKQLTITQHFYQPVPYIFEIVVDRDHGLMFTRAGTSGVQPFRINSDFTITKLTESPIATGIYFLGAGLSPSGANLYFGGGISGGGHSIGGFSVDAATGAIAPLAGSPFASKGSSPKQVVVSSGGLHAFVSHGTDATIRTFAIEPEGGELTQSQAALSMYDVGSQGDCGNMSVMGDFLFVTRRYSSTQYGPSGVISLTVTDDGSLSPNGSTYSTSGSLPWDIATWPGVVASCPADIDGSQVVDVGDLLAIVAAWGSSGSDGQDITGDGIVSVSDLLAVVSAWGACP